MKVTFIIVLINLVIVCYGLSSVKGYTKKTCNQYQIDLDDDDKGKVLAYSTDFCRSLNYSYFRCCYVHAKLSDNTYRGCYDITYSQYANAGDLKANDTTFNDSFTDFSIHCNSKYLTIAVSFIAFVFVFALF